eukprot:TRINITY_DN4786_c0_g1_i1.p1 TRINITY_DN4786_c0_g1~~TRINITY_DN4786_c0_g1_i1.p1  ORF type:complete len:365 (-),score=73.97 TRINITY_DN4786_c0_g1_i1:131-1225(-)
MCIRDSLGNDQATDKVDSDPDFRFDIQQNVSRRGNLAQTLIESSGIEDLEGTLSILLVQQKSSSVAVATKEESGLKLESFDIIKKNFNHTQQVCFYRGYIFFCESHSGGMQSQSLQNFFKNKFSEVNNKPMKVEVNSNSANINSNITDLLLLPDPSRSKIWGFNANLDLLKQGVTTDTALFYDIKVSMDEDLASTGPKLEPNKCETFSPKLVRNPLQDVRVELFVQDTINLYVLLETAPDDRILIIFKKDLVAGKHNVTFCKGPPSIQDLNRWQGSEKISGITCRRNDEIGWTQHVNYRISYSMQDKHVYYEEKPLVLPPDIRGNIDFQEDYQIQLKGENFFFFDTRKYNILQDQTEKLGLQFK